MYINICNKSINDLIPLSFLVNIYIYQCYMDITDNDDGVGVWKRTEVYIG